MVARESAVTRSASLSPTPKWIQVPHARGTLSVDIDPKQYVAKIRIQAAQFRPLNGDHGWEDIMGSLWSS